MRCFVKLPNGLWAIYSTVDGYVIYDATIDDLLKFRVDEQTEILKRELESLETDTPLVNIGNYESILKYSQLKAKEEIEPFISGETES